MPNLGYLNAGHRYRLRVSSLLPTEADNSEAFSAKESKVIALPDQQGDQPNAGRLQ